MFNYNDYKYILKRVIIYFLIAFAMFIIGTFKAHALNIAQVWINNNELGANNYVTANGSVAMKTTIQDNDNKPYYLYKICADTQYITNISYNSNYVIAKMYVANQSCSYPGSSYRSNYTLYASVYYNTSQSPNVTQTINFRVPQNTSFYLIDFVYSNGPIEFDTNGNNYDSKFNELKEQNTTIINQNTQINNSVNDINNTINDSSVDTNQAQSAFGDLDNSLPSNGTISSLITMPITIINQIISAFGGTCSSYNIGQLWGYDFILPCINPTDYVGATLWGILDTICSGFIAFVIGKRFVVIFNELSNLKDGGLKSAYD